MKKVFLLAAGLAMILTACQKEESLSDPGGVCTQAITVTIPQELQTRAMAADFGNGSQVDRCLFQIYRNGQLHEFANRCILEKRDTRICHGLQ